MFVFRDIVHLTGKLFNQMYVKFIFLYFCQLLKTLVLIHA